MLDLWIYLYLHLSVLVCIICFFFSYFITDKQQLSDFEAHLQQSTVHILKATAAKRAALSTPSFIVGFVKRALKNG